MSLRNRGVLTAVFYWAIFNNLDPGMAENPVFHIKPTPQGEGTPDALISYKSGNLTSYSTWTAALDTFLRVYRMPGLVPGRGQNIRICNYENPPPSGGVCDVDIRHWYPCHSENHYGYHRASPCVFLTLDTVLQVIFDTLDQDSLEDFTWIFIENKFLKNHPVGWVPEFYNDTNSLPANMPAYLKSHITNLANTNPLALKSVWISCEGVYPADLELIGPIQFFPSLGIPGYYFLNNNAEGYLSPLVALQFERPSYGVLINIQCKAWARNIDLNNDSVLESGRFSLMVD